MAILDVKQSGGTYSTLNAALAVADPSDTISIEGSWTIDDTTAASIADDNLTIETDASSKHPGYWDEATSQHYRLVVSGSHALTLSGAYTLTIDGVAIEQSGTGTSDECFRCVPGSSDTVTIQNCILQCSTNTNQQDCIYTGYNTSIGVVDIEQCIIYGAARAGLNIQNFYTSTNSGTININSCTIWNCGLDGSLGAGAHVGGGILYGVTTGGDGSSFTINVHNTTAVENDTGGNYSVEYPEDYREYVSDGIGVGAWNVSYSIDSDNTISANTDGGTGNLASRTATDNTSPGGGDWVIFEDISSAPYDLRIVDNAEDDAQDAHTTATAHGLTIPSTDIVGTSRPQNTNYDIGAFEIEVAGDLSVSESDSVNATDTPSLAPIVIPNLVESESVTVTDSPAMYLGLALAESDSVTVTDAPAFTALLLNVTELDAVTVADSPSVSGLELLTLSISESDGVTVGDTATTKGGDMGIPVTVDNPDYQYSGVRVVDG